MIKFPLFLIDQTPCNEFDFPNLFFESPVFFDNENLDEYNSFFHRRRYVDVTGDVYESVKANNKTARLRKLLGMRYRYHLEFKMVGIKKMTFEEVREVYFNYLTGFESDEAKQKHIDFANNCASMIEPSHWYPMDLREYFLVLT